MPFFDGLSFPSFLVTIVGGTHRLHRHGLEPDARAARASGIDPPLRRRLPRAISDATVPSRRFLTPEDAAARRRRASPRDSPDRRPAEQVEVGRARRRWRRGIRHPTATASSPATGWRPSRSASPRHHTPTLGFAGRGVGRDVDDVERHRDTGLLERLARGGGPHVLAPFDVAAREAPASRAELVRPALDEEHASVPVADHARGADAGVREEVEAARGTGRTLDAAAHAARQRTAAARARDPVVADARYASRSRRKATSRGRVRRRVGSAIAGRVSFMNAARRRGRADLEGLAARGEARRSVDVGEGDDRILLAVGRARGGGWRTASRRRARLQRRVEPGRVTMP